MPPEKQKPRIGRLIIDTFPYVMHVLMHGVQLSELDPRLTKTQMNTLYILHIHGRLNMSTLSRHVNREKGSFTPVIDSLEKLGFVERQPDPSDRRVVNVSMTAEGKGHMEAAGKVILKHLNEKLGVLTLSERNEFHEAVLTINRLSEKIAEEKI
jgi:DNA-binding MarR family transcriptional regulator